MRAAFRRNLRCQGGWALRYLAYSLVLTAVFTLFSALTCPVDQIGPTVASFLPLYLLFCAAMLLSLGVGLVFYQTYAVLCLCMGSTRRGVFAAQQAVKLLGCAAALLAATGCGQLLGGGVVWQGASLTVFFGMVLLCTLCELAGLLGYRYGGWAPLLAALVWSGLGCGGGILLGKLLFADGTMDGLAQMTGWAAALKGWGLPAVLAAAAALLSAAGWGLFRKAAVKV